MQVGKRNFWEVNAAMATVVGISPEQQLTLTASKVMSGGREKNAEEREMIGAGANTEVVSTKTDTQHTQPIVTAWQDVFGMMARWRAIDGCDPSTQVGVFRLASAYCNHLVNNKTAWQDFSNKNFSGQEIGELSKLSKSNIAAGMLDGLQTGSKLNSKQQEKSITTIVNYMQDAGDSVSKETLFDICTMVLGSASSMLN